MIYTFDKSLESVIMISTHKLSRSFGSHVAVDSLNLELNTSELFGLLGPNGAGKTTTMRMLVGLLPPTSGQAHVGGYDIESQPIEVKRTIGYLPQSPMVYDFLSGREFIIFYGGLFGLDDTEIEAALIPLVEQLGLSEDIDREVGGYSGGMRQKLALCAALIHQPRVLILDEPLAGLDPISARKVKDLLRQRCHKGDLVLLSTHILEVAERVCDRVGILHRGRLAAVGTLNELRQMRQGRDDQSLEDIFLELTRDEQLSQALEG
jgi:ABC-2 type transport system ATP-binding protein